MKYPEIAKRFSYILKKRKMKAQDLADRSGLSKSAISLYVNGERCPTNKTALILGDVLGVSPLWLMGFDVTPDRERSAVEISREEAEMNTILRGLAPDRRSVLLEYARLFYEMERKKRPE